MSDEARLLEDARKLLRKAEEWAAKYPLQGSGSHADHGAANDVYQSIRAFLARLDAGQPEAPKPEPQTHAFVLHDHAVEGWLCRLCHYEQDGEACLKPEGDPVHAQPYFGNILDAAREAGALPPAEPEAGKVETWEDEGYESGGPQGWVPAPAPTKEGSE